MNLKGTKILLFLLYAFVFLLFLFPAFKTLNAGNTGFMPESIWYSKDPFSEGDKIKIYTLIWNGDQRELSGTVSFFDKDILLGKKSFIVAGADTQEVSIDWTATAGAHRIYGKIENAVYLVSPGQYEDAYLDKTETPESKRTVSKKIIEGEGTASTSEEEEKHSLGYEQIKNIQRVIGEKTPSFIAKPIIAAVEAVETFRTNMADKIDNKIVSTIFDNKFVFYGIFIVIVVLILRSLWRLIF